MYSTFINVLYIKMQTRNIKISGIKYNSLSIQFVCTFIHALYQHLFGNT